MDFFSQIRIFEAERIQKYPSRPIHEKAFYHTQTSLPHTNAHLRYVDSCIFLNIFRLKNYAMKTFINKLIFPYKVDFFLSISELVCKS